MIIGDKRPKHNIDALIILYHPDIEPLKRQLDILKSSVRLVWLVWNSPNDQSMNKFLDEQVRVIENFSNIGLGAALNTGIRAAIDAGADFCWTFDQDSEISPNAIGAMLDAFWAYGNGGAGVACVVPKIVDRRNSKFSYSCQYELPEFKDSENFKLQSLALQSGMLIPCDILRKHMFDEYLFIEFVDTEWCWRVKAHGLVILQAPSAILLHEVSDAQTRKFLGSSLLKYKPIRRFYFARNAVTLLGRDYIPIADKIKLLRGMFNRLLSIFICDENKLKSLLSFFVGLRDGLFLRK